MAQGRLDHAEFDERLTKALGARTAADLEPLFDDLPEPRPAGLVPTTPFAAPPWSATGASAVAVPPPAENAVAPAAPQSRALAVFMAALWPATIVLYVLTGFDYWWLFVVAGMLSWFVKRAFSAASPEQPSPHDPEQPPPAVGR